MTKLRYFWMLDGSFRAKNFNSKREAESYLLVNLKNIGTYNMEEYSSEYSNIQK